MKTRYATYQKMKIPEQEWIPSGLVDMFEKQGLIVKDGNRLKYIDSQVK